MVSFYEPQTTSHNFGRLERKLITIDFLNAIAAEDLGHSITDIVFTPTENVPDSHDEKLTRLI